MAFGSYYGFRPYVPVAERRRQAEKAAKKFTGKGRLLAPVRIEGRTIATTFWGQAWCRNLEAYSDYTNRLPRGRTYLRNGSVIDLQIAPGTVTALVQGSSLYKITVRIKPLTKVRWNEFKARSAGRIGNLLDLLQGRLSKDILSDLTGRDTGLFPTPQEIDLGCSCPDWADMCKHVAAVLYGVGARLDREPALFFTLRGVDVQELITAASASISAGIPDAGASATGLADSDLSEIFGVELDTTAAKVPESNSVVRKNSAKKNLARPSASVAGGGADRRAKKKPSQSGKLTGPNSRRPTKAGAKRRIRGM